MAKSRPLDLKGNKGFKVLLLNEVDKLSKEAQHSLRRTMEKYSSACRLVLSCSNVSKVGPLHKHTTAYFSLCVRALVLHHMMLPGGKLHHMREQQLPGRIADVSAHCMRA